MRTRVVREAGLTPVAEHSVLLVNRWDGDDEALVGMNFSDRPAPVKFRVRKGRLHRAGEVPWS